MSLHVLGSVVQCLPRYNRERLIDCCISWVSAMRYIRRLTRRIETHRCRRRLTHGTYWWLPGVSEDDDDDDVDDDDDDDDDFDGDDDDSPSFGTGRKPT